MNRLVALATVVMSLGFASDAGAVTATGTLTATIIRPIGVTNTNNTPLAFGTIVRGSTTSTVTVDNAGNITIPTGNAVALGSSHSAAPFNVTGEGAQSFTLSVPATVTLTGAGSLTVNTTNSAGCTTACTLSGSLGSAGNLAFSVGGSFSLPPMQPNGSYAGTLTVTATYN